MINNYLKQCREALALQYGKKAYSQVAVAEKVGASKSYISRVENGTEKPSRDFLVRVSDVYSIDKNITLAIGGYLSEEMSAVIKLDNRCMSLLHEFSKLNQSQQSAFIQSFESDGRVELIWKLGKNRLFSQIVSNLLLFDTNELDDLAESLPQFTKKSLDFD